MANNNFTELFMDGAALTQAQIETAIKSITLDIGNTTQMTTGTTSGTYLKSNGDGLAASFAALPDVIGPFAVRNYGLATSVSSGAITVTLNTNAGTTPSAGNPVEIPFSTNGSVSATYSKISVIGALSFTVSASATLGTLRYNSASLKVLNTSTQRVYIYALNNASTPLLGASSRSDFDQGAAVTTTVMSHTADSGSLLYATAALSVVPRLLGFFDSALNSTGSWQTSTNVDVTNTVSATRFDVLSTLILTGCTTGPIGTASAAKVGKTVTLTLPTITATSNTIAATLVGLNPTLYPISTQTCLGRVRDNGIDAVGLIQIATNGTITLFKDAGAGSFTSSGSKGVLGTTITYNVAI